MSIRGLRLAPFDRVRVLSDGVYKHRVGELASYPSDYGNAVVRFGSGAYGVEVIFGVDWLELVASEEDKP